LELDVLAEAPLRQTVVPLQRWQIRSPAQALSNMALQLRQVRWRRVNAPGAEKPASSRSRR
jgi:hypothetical protein